ncbi:uncharacterized protein LACBIDRAFT_296173 [Laccaria bicolor S238N-H82]|uniref:Predicted protein n=1 Tax=Laccaria bicolor (strain S238N-H82 / ATCC MYA-4686) TaxID=486041 RepID=B0E2Z1_LACBS|nr:uncharacterized protein LACBIDRAFT_296173 [Laccaria bicolor S238N-H82]EDQ98791.1 predicted protein [Laccaria bicolor S238N-H82]|eukprot:XP_001890558.1 predicted protein [Laccaria bicolor S238N-H82]
MSYSSWSNGSESWSSATGVGKSSLINECFGVKDATVAHSKAGVSNINTPIIASENRRFVLHDSQGFEHGEGDNFKKVVYFLKARKDMPNVRDQVHAVWLCFQVSLSEGDRLFEAGVEELFRMKSKGELGPATKGYKDTRKMLNELVRLTTDYVKNTLAVDVAGDVALVSAIAQRVNPAVKIDAVIAVGKKRYWMGLAASAKFLGNTIEECQRVLHTDIVQVWNIQDDCGARRDVII